MKKVLRKLPGYNTGKKVYHGFGRIHLHARNNLVQTSRILLYHRIADVQHDPHLLSVSPENFRAQIKFLKENYHIIPLVQLVQNIRAKKVQNNTIVITFDDGYADNLHNALPILEEFGVPATIFISTEYIGKTGFPWEENTPPEHRGRSMSPEELKRLSERHLIEIGAHTLTHPKLAKLSQNEQAKEISDCKPILEKLVDLPILSFAYPFGSKDSFNDTSVAVVKQSGYHYACANIHERVTNESDIFTLPRFIPRNWNLEEFKKKFKEFL